MNTLNSFLSDILPATGGYSDHIEYHQEKSTKEKEEYFPGGCKKFN